MRSLFCTYIYGFEQPELTLSLDFTPFRISFLPQAFLLENIKERPHCISRFLLLSILTVAAPWTPTFVKKYGGSREAGEFFYSQAKLMLGTEMLKPTLQACQSCKSLSWLLACYSRADLELCYSLSAFNLSMGKR